MSSPNPTPKLWPERWAVHASVEADRIEYKLRVVTAGLPPGPTSAAADAVRHHAERAREACRNTSRLNRRGWRDRWRGTSVENAYQNLHTAKAFLVDVLPEYDVDALVPDVVTRLGMTLDRNDPRRIEAESMLARTRGPQRRAVLRLAMETAYDASDEEYARLRNFRNIVLLTAAAIALFAAILLAAVAFSPNTIPMCFEPSVTSAVPGAAPVAAVPQVCPSGDGQRPTGGDILVVAGLGAVGGILGALVAVRSLRGSSTPYSVSTALAVLKVPSGALSAVIGMLLLAGGFIPGLTNLDNQRQILAYSLVFGLAQQLVTRVADLRAQQILDQLPSKDPLARQAQASAPQASPPPPPPPQADPAGAAPAAAAPPAAAPAAAAPPAVAPAAAAPPAAPAAAAAADSVPADDSVPAAEPSANGDQAPPAPDGDPPGPAAPRRPARPGGRRPRPADGPDLTAQHAD